MALYVPNEELILCGGFRRRVPVGGSAKGILQKLSMPPVLLPMTVPFCILTEGDASLLFKGAADAAAKRSSGMYMKECILAMIENKDLAEQLKECI